MAEFLDEEDEYAKEAERAANTKGYLNVLGGVAQQFQDVPSAHETLFGGKSHKTDVAGMMKNVADNIQNPMDSKAKAMAYMKAKRENSLGKEQDAKTAMLKDPNSVQSKARKALAMKYGVEVTPEMSGYDVEQLMDPKKMFETQAAANVSFEKQKELAKINHGYDMQKLSAQTKSRPGEGLTEGQRSVDKDYAKHYNDFTGKGKVNAQQTINQLTQLQNELKKESGNFIQAGGGRLGSMLPDQLRSTDSIRWKSEIPAKANLVLKDLFGGQLSDGERLAEAKTYYNDLLSPEENAKVLEKKIDTLKKQLQSESAKASFYERNGSLKGFATNGSQRQVVKQQVNKKTGETRVVYDDGSTETISSTAGR